LAALAAIVPSSVNVHGLRVELFAVDAPVSLDQLSDAERALAPPRGPGREQWLTGRAALRLALGGCTAGVAMPDPGLSLSHSGQLAVAARASGLAGLGVDLEARPEIAPDASRFFLRPEEESCARGDGRALLCAWCAKEAAFKADPANRGQALVQYRLEARGDFHGLVWTPTGRMIYYSVIYLGDMTLAVACNTGERGLGQAE
jgi:4'-phosphopantetheinyl transferase EntD